MAKTVYIKTGITGGTANDLDGIDGSGLLDGDVAHVYSGNQKYEYILDDDLSGVLDSPYLINPVANPGTKTWVLQIIPITAGGTGATTDVENFDAIAPTTTKGDLIVHDGTDNIRLGIGADNSILMAASGETSGQKWQAFATYAELNAGAEAAKPIAPSVFIQRVASAATKGILEIATYAETNTGTDDTRAVTPARLKARVASAVTAGVIEIATYAETNTGTDDTRALTPARLVARIASPTTAGVIEIATSAETIAMTDATRAVTPDDLGELLQYQEAIIWASAFVPGTTASASFGSYEWATNDIVRDYFAFDGAADEHIRFSHIFPETWDQSTIKVKFVWAGDTGSTSGDTCSWAIKGRFSRDDDALDAAWGTAATIGDALTDDGPIDTQITATVHTALTLAGTAAVGCVCDFDVYRDVSEDNMSEDAWLFAVKIQFKNTLAKASW